MDAKTFLRDYGEAEASLVAERAGTKLIYLKQIATGFRRPSSRLAQRLAIASGNRMDVMSLLFPPADESPPPGDNHPHAGSSPSRQL